MIYHKAVCKSIIPVRLSPRPDSLFANWKVKLGESRRTLYGVVDVQASDMQSFLLCLVVVPPIFANGAVYTLYRQTCMQTSGLAKKFSLGLGLEPRFRPGRSVPFRQVRISRRLSSLDMDRSVRKNEEHKREVSMRWYHAAIELFLGRHKTWDSFGSRHEDCRCYKYTQYDLPRASSILLIQTHQDPSNEAKMKYTAPLLALSAVVHAAHFSKEQYESGEVHQRIIDMKNVRRRSTCHRHELIVY
jgi:hypothetical protein